MLKAMTSIRATLLTLCLVTVATAGCDDDDGNGGTGGTATGMGTGAGTGTGSGGGAAGELTIDNCETNVAADVPEFYATYFRCVDISMEGGDVVIHSNDLPPHLSAYYPTDDANWIAWDEAGGNMQIPGTILEQNISLRIASDPVEKGITIDGSLLDGTLMTSDEEYDPGPIGLALDGVAYFSGAAAMGMNIADEAATFDRYDAHHAMGTYHYHGQTPGPLEVLEKVGVVTSSVPGDAEVELYAVMCDGTLVLGCTELDGSAPDTSDMDAQGGHVHDIGDGTAAYFTGRYHTHVCPGMATFSPEIQYYDNCP